MRQLLRDFDADDRTPTGWSWSSTSIVPAEPPPLTLEQSITRALACMQEQLTAAMEAGNLPAVDAWREAYEQLQQAIIATHPREEGGGVVAWIDTCPKCKGSKSGRNLMCRECSGENARTSYSQRTANFATGMRVAALEEMRVRAAVERVEQSLGLWGLE